MHLIISFVLVTLALSSSLVSSSDWSKYYTGFCDSHEYYSYRSSSDQVSSYGCIDPDKLFRSECLDLLHSLIFGYCTERGNEIFFIDRFPEFQNVLKAVFSQFSYAKTNVNVVCCMQFGVDSGNIVVLTIVPLYRYCIYPGSEEHEFWELAVNLIKDNSGWGEYSELPKQFAKAVRKRNRETGTLNFERDMPSLQATSYTQAVRTIRRLIAIDMHQWYYYPDCNSLRRLIEQANRVVNLRQMQLDRGRRDGDSKNIIDCHKHALGLWSEFRNKLEDLYNEEYVDKGYCNNCGHCIRTNERHQSTTKKVDGKLALHLMECYVCRQRSK